MKTKRPVVFGALLILVTSLLVGAQSNDSKFDAAPIEREIRAFYDAYADDLRALRGSGVANRYDRRGAYFLGNGEKRFEPYDKIVETYSKWKGPKSFQWKDLSVEVLSPDVAAVVGRFEWQTQTGEFLNFSYTAVLIRKEGMWRIRIEDESRKPPTPKPASTQAP